jgi:hypothetical protein
VIEKMAKKLTLFSGIALLAAGILGFFMGYTSYGVPGIFGLLWGFVIVSIGISVAGVLLLIEGTRSDSK